MDRTEIAAIISVIIALIIFIVNKSIDSVLLNYAVILLAGWSVGYIAATYVMHR